MASSLVDVTTKDADREKASRRIKTIGYCVAFVALGLTHASFGPTLTNLAQQVAVEISAISFVFTVRSLGYLAGSFLGGRLYDRVAGNPVMGGMLILMALCMGVLPLIPALGVLAFVMFLLGMFEGALDVGGNTLLVWVHRDKVGPYMNAMHFFFGVGSFLSPIIIARALLLSEGIKWGYWVLALIILPVAFALLRLPSPSAPGTEDLEASTAATAENAAANGAQRSNGLLVFLIAIFFVLYVGAEGSFGGWIATYAKAMGLGNETTAAYLTSAFWGALTVGRLLSIPIAARFKPRTILLSDLLICLISVALVVLWPTIPAVLWIGTCGAGLGMASIFPTMISFAERHMTISGKVTGWFFVGGSTGGMTLPFLIGQLFESIGPRITITAIFANTALALGMFAIIMATIRAKEPVVETATR